MSDETTGCSDDDLPGTADQWRKASPPSLPEGEKDEALREILAKARKDERDLIARQLDQEGDNCPCREDAQVCYSNANLVRAESSYEDADRIETESEREYKRLTDALAAEREARGNIVERCAKAADERSEVEYRTARELFLQPGESKHRYAVNVADDIATAIRALN